jgi:two-component system KDP operon response regulator KdpE
MAKILVIDDDPSLNRALRLGLQAGGHDVTSATTGEHGLSQTALTAPDVVVLDLGLPDMDGIEVCRTIRGWSDVPIIILSAIGAENRKVTALDAGANDYVTKPFSMPELEARIRAVTRGRGIDRDDPAEATLSCGSLQLDLVHHDVSLDGVNIALTTKEFEVLAFLARHSGKTCTHQMILGAVWGTGYGAEAQYLHAYVHRLRQKLNDESAELITTVPGVGYSLKCND